MTDATLASRATLRRALGLRTVVTTSTGLAFAALEYLAAAGLVAYVAGDSACIPIIVAGVLALLAYGFFGELNGMFPTAAAIRLYMKRAMDDRAALTITFTYMTTIVLVIASDAFIVGSALGARLRRAGVGRLASGSSACWPSRSSPTCAASPWPACCRTWPPPSSSWPRSSSACWPSCAAATACTPPSNPCTGTVPATSSRRSRSACSSTARSNG